MKTLTTKTILYDDHCPMCNWYTGKFIAAGVLPADGRTAFDACDMETLPVDSDRARHEIALLDRAGGETLYGIDSLFKLVGSWVPAFQPVLRMKPFRWLMKQLYCFISYNRRVLAGQSAQGGCAPDYHQGWRLALVAVCFLFALAGYFAFGMQLGGTPAGGLVWMAAAGAGWLVHMGWGLIKMNPRHEYAGQLAVVQVLSGLTFMAGAALITFHPGLTIMAMLLAFSSPLWLMVVHAPRLEKAGLGQSLAISLPVVQWVVGAAALILGSAFF